MNDTQSDTESVSSDSESCPTLSRLPRGNSINHIKKLQAANPYSSRPLSVSCTDGKNSKVTTESTDSDFFTKQARLQIEARMALAQAKDMAHMQMEVIYYFQLNFKGQTMIRNIFRLKSKNKISPL